MQRASPFLKPYVAWKKHVSGPGSGEPYLVTHGLQAHFQSALAKQRTQTLCLPLKRSKPQKFTSPGTQGVSLCHLEHFSAEVAQTQKGTKVRNVAKDASNGNSFIGAAWNKQQDMASMVV